MSTGLVIHNYEKLDFLGNRDPPDPSPGKGMS